MFKLPAVIAAPASPGLLIGAYVCLLLCLGCNPVIIIECPEEGDSFAYHETITFSCTALDLPEGLLAGDAIIWSSSLNAEIGRGRFFSRKDLLEGRHVITVTAMDSSGMFTRACISIQIGEARPQVVITSPSQGAGFHHGETILFSGTAEDPQEGALNAAALTWTSDRDGRIGTGTAFETDNLTAAQHMITLTAMNSQGTSGSATVGIAVEAIETTTTLSPAPPEALSTTSSSTILTTTSTALVSSTTTAVPSITTTTSTSIPTTQPTTSSSTSSSSSSSSTTTLAHWIEMSGGSGSNLNALWGTSAQEIYAVGQQGRLLRYDGSVWIELASPTTYDLNNIFGASSALIAAVGKGGMLAYTLDGSNWEAHSIDSAELNAIWIAPTGEIFTAGSSGKILHSTDNGLTWPEMSSGTSLALYDMWNASATDIYAVGGNTFAGGSIIIAYNGSTWAQAYANNANEALYGIWGASATDIFAVGGQYPPAGIILHYDGSNWSYMNISSSYNLYGIWGSSSSDVYAVGGNSSDSGIIFHYDGNTWSLIGTAGHHLNAVWGTSGTDIYAVGNQVILKYVPE